MGYLAEPGDWVCGVLPKPRLLKVCELDPTNGGRYWVKERGNPERFYVQQHHCRVLPKVGEAVVILTRNWMAALQDSNKKRESISLSAEESFWLQSVCTLESIIVASGNAVIKTTDEEGAVKQLRLPYICLASYVKQAQLISELNKATQLNKVGLK